MKNLTIAVALLAGLTMSAADAGMNANTRISVQARSASGAFTDGRFSSASQEYIFCSHTGRKSVGTDTALGIRWITCRAQDSAGNQYACTSVNPPQAWVDVVEGLNAASYVQFSGDSNGNCTMIYSVRGSLYL